MLDHHMGEHLHEYEKFVSAKEGSDFTSSTMLGIEAANIKQALILCICTNGANDIDNLSVYRIKFLIVIINNDKSLLKISDSIYIIILLEFQNF